MEKKTIIIGSRNPVKVDAATQAFYAVFPEGVHEFIEVDAPSGVSLSL
jgi:non-canonical (house-cleaning) NTP pyrophosphatase